MPTASMRLAVLINWYLQMIKTLEIDTDLIIYAFRYCLGRQDYCAKLVTEQLSSVWQDLDTAQRSLIKREIKRTDIVWGFEIKLGLIVANRHEWLKILELPD